MNLSRDDSTVKQGIFFFLLSAQKKKKQKEKAPAAAPELKNRRISLNEKNSLTLKRASALAAGAFHFFARTKKRNKEIRRLPLRS